MWRNLSSHNKYFLKTFTSGQAPPLSHKEPMWLEARSPSPPLASSMKKHTDNILQSHYNLNRDKARMNKFLAANIQDVNHKIINGGHCVTFSTGMYKIVKRKLPEFFYKHHIAFVTRKHVKCGSLTIITQCTPCLTAIPKINCLWLTCTIQLQRF